MYGLVVRFNLKDGSGEIFDALTSEAVALIRDAEPGTLNYACHADDAAANPPGCSVLYRDKDAFEEHERQEHVRRFHERKERCLAGEPRVEFLNLQVGKGTPQPDVQRP
jgi:quinol monooxygenase YgiN